MAKKWISHAAALRTTRKNTAAEAELSKLRQTQQLFRFRSRSYEGRDRAAQSLKMPRKQQYLIGELAKAVGVKSDTIRFYERSGLLPRPTRTEAGYRTYDTRSLQKLRFIKKAQALGLASTKSAESSPCEEARKPAVA